MNIAKNDNHFLLVDDQPANLFAIRMILDNFGHSYEEASHGLEAFKRYHPGKFTAIFMDIEMPIMNGYEACEKIREFEDCSNLSHTPIFIITANSIIEVEQKTGHLDISVVIGKPFTMSHFIEHIQHLAA